MELILNIDKYEEKKGDVSSSFSELEMVEKSKRNITFGQTARAEIVNIGPGADWIVVFLIIDIGLRLIKVGSEINDGIDGWIEIGKKLCGLFRRKKIVSVDSEGATALAISLVAKKKKIMTLEKINEQAIHLSDLSGVIRGNKGLSNRPHNYYLQEMMMIFTL